MSSHHVAFTGHCCSQGAAAPGLGAYLWSSQVGPGSQGTEHTVWAEVPALAIPLRWDMEVSVHD